jgi:N-acetylneuraminate lyase/4-hydroxy-tetrahydrodipicolinate synthase
VGIKDSSGSMVDFLHFMDKTQRTGSDFHLLTGREETLMPCLIMGAKGCVTGTSGILPEIMVGIYQAWTEGKYDEARALQTSILPLIRAMFAPPFPLGFKMALEMRGFNMGPPKQPLSDAEISKLRTTRARIEEIMEPLIETIEREVILK